MKTKNKKKKERFCPKSTNMKCHLFTTVPSMSRTVSKQSKRTHIIIHCSYNKCNKEQVSRLYLSLISLLNLLMYDTWILLFWTVKRTLSKLRVTAFRGLWKASQEQYRTKYMFRYCRRHYCHRNWSVGR